MASVFAANPSPVERERRFFLAMSLLLIASALLGFGYFQYAGISSWGAPWWVHVHAVSQMGWLGFYALQNLLVMRGDVDLHRRLGVFGAGFAVWLILAALVTSTLFMTTGRDDGSLQRPYQLALNWMTLLTFAGLFATALRLRHNSDWHKRLMLCAVTVLSVPSFGRILIMLGLSSTANRVGLILAIIAIGMGFDLWNRRIVHPAWLWGAAAVIVMGLTVETIQDFAPLVEFASGLAP